MEHSAAAAPHDNVDVRMNNKITVHGNVVFIGSISVAGVGFLFLAIWMITYWQQALLLSAIFVYGMISLVGLTLVGLVAALWIKLVVVPGATAYQKRVEAQGQAYLNQVIHTQENAIVIADGFGVKVIPLFAQQVIEAPKQEPYADKKTVLELFDLGNGLKEIEARTGVSYYYVQKWTSEHKAAKKAIIDV